MTKINYNHFEATASGSVLEPSSPYFPMSWLPNPYLIPPTTSLLKHDIFAGHCLGSVLVALDSCVVAAPISAALGPELCPFPEPHPGPVDTYSQHSLDTSGTLTRSLLLLVSPGTELYLELIACVSTFSSLCSSCIKAHQKPGRFTALTENLPGVPK